MTVGERGKQIIIST